MSMNCNHQYDRISSVKKNQMVERTNKNMKKKKKIHHSQGFRTEPVNPIVQLIIK